MSEYGEQKGVGITCAKRLCEFLGPDIAKGKSLCCNYVISARPVELTKSERAIPVQIFNAEVNVRRRFLKKWLRDNSMNES